MNQLVTNIELETSVLEHYCTNCNALIITNRFIDCILDTDAQFCTELCEAEYEDNTRENW